MLATCFIQNLPSVLVFVSIIVPSVIVLVVSVFVKFTFKLSVPARLVGDTQIS